MASLVYERENCGGERGLVDFRSLEQAIVIFKDEQICSYCSRIKNDIATFFLFVFYLNSR